MARHPGDGTVSGYSPTPETGVERSPSWPAWFAPVGFAVALVLVVVIVALLTGLAAASGSDVSDDSHGLTLVATLVQDAAFVGVAIALAATRLRPRAWHFGLRRTRFWPAVGWTVLAVIGFYVFAAVYTALVEPTGKQTVVEDLGAEESTALLIASAVLVVGVAPVAEELFFRAFFYGALRSRFGVLTAATLDGILFGAIHYTGPDTVSIIPPLAFLGFVFCLLYERTGSLYPVIAFHALNNMIALSAQTGSDGAPAALAVGGLAIAGSILAPRLQRRASPPPVGAAAGTA